MDIGYWSLFEDLDWTYGVVDEDRRRVLGTGMRILVGRQNDPRSKITIDVDRAVFQRAKAAILVETERTWPGDSPAERMRRFLEWKLDECLTTTGYGDVSVEFAGVDGFHVTYDEWDLPETSADLERSRGEQPRRFIRYRGDETMPGHVPE